MARILIAEDEAHIVRVMSLWLTRHGHEVFETPDGARALEVFRRESIDLIISDMNMPEMDGYELAKTVRDELHSDVPFMLLTARCDQETMSARLKPLNVHLYPKPFTPSRLVAQIDLLLGVGAKEDAVL